MFSFGKKKKEPRKRPTPRLSNSKKSPFDEFGVGPQPDDEELEAELQAITGFQASIDSPVIGGDDDEDVEAELLRLIGAGKSKKPLKTVEKDIPPLKEINSDAFSGSIEEGDEDIDVDENDPELLNELLELTNPTEEMQDEDESSETEDSSSKEEPDILTILNERLEMYKTAEKKAKESNESSRARRFNRGIKTLQDLIKKAEKGQQILMGDIPPLIATNLKPPPPATEITGGQTENIVNQPDGDNDHVKLSNEQKKAKLPDVKSDNNNQEEEFKIQFQPEPSQPQDNNDKVMMKNENIKNMPYTKIPPEIPPKLPPKLPSKEKPGLSTPETPPKPEIIPREKPKSSPEKEFKPDVYPREKPSPSIPEPTPKPDVPPLREKPKLDIVNIPSSSKKPVTTDNPLLASLKSQREEYKQLALKSKKNNEMQSALEYVKKVKEITAKITAIENGEPIEQASPTSLPSPTKTGKPMPNTSPKRKPTSPGTSAPSSSIILETPNTVLEVLEQRLRIFNDLLQKCEKQNDKTAALKNRKIVQIYIDAIRLHKMGKKVPLEKLPSCQGCPPFPITF